MNWLCGSDLHLSFRKIFLIIVFFPIVMACGNRDEFELDWPGRDSGYLVPDAKNSGDPHASGVAVSGTLQVDQKVSCDWDVNDPAAPYQNNDTAQYAQSVTAPVTVGGFVRWSASGPDGRSSMSWDTGDYYRATLAKGDTIHVEKIDQSAGGTIRLELRPVNAPDRIVGAYALATGDRIDVEQNNEYFLYLYATEGAFNYILRIATQAGDAYPSGHTSEDFVPGEVIIRFKDSNRVVQSNTGTRAWSLANRFLPADAPTNQPVLMEFKTPEQQIRLQQYLKIPTAAVSKHGPSPANDTLAVIAALNQRPDVVYAEPNYIRQLKFTPNDEYYPLQWHYPFIGLEDAWDITLGSDDIIVAVIDNGIRFDHPDLIQKIAPDGFDFIRDPNFSLDGDGIDSDPTDPQSEAIGSGSFHGTHVSGVIAAAVDNGIGVAGVGGHTRILPIRTIGFQGMGTVMDTLQGLRYAAGMSNISGQIPPRPADIVNLSLGGNVYSQAEAELFDELISQRNIVVVAAAGNDASNIPVYPAAYPGVISVSALALNRTPASYSNFGDDIDLAAPGGDLNEDINGDSWGDGVLSTVGREDYSFMQGTSMAAPHVSGVVALMKAVKPDLTPADVLGWLAHGHLSIDLGQSGWDSRYGYGLINAHKAVTTAQNAPELPQGASANPAQLALGGSLNKAALRLAKIGQDPLTLNEIVCSMDWLEVTEGAVDDDGFGTYWVEVDRSHPDLMQAGAYNGQVEFLFPRQTVSAKVSVTVGDSSSNFGDDHYIGHLHVLLLALDNTTRYGVTAEYAGKGRYQFNFSNVAPGQYRIVAGSNRDNDERIGEPGEALSLKEQNIDLSTDTTIDDTITVAYNLL